MICIENMESDLHSVYYTDKEDVEVKEEIFEKDKSHLEKVDVERSSVTCFGNGYSHLHMDNDNLNQKTIGTVLNNMSKTIPVEVKKEKFENELSHFENIDYTHCFQLIDENIDGIDNIHTNIIDENINGIDNIHTNRDTGLRTIKQEEGDEEKTTEKGHSCLDNSDKIYVFESTVLDSQNKSNLDVGRFVRLIDIKQEIEEDKEQISEIAMEERKCPKTATLHPNVAGNELANESSDIFIDTDNRNVADGDPGLENGDFEIGEQTSDSLVENNTYSATVKYDNFVPTKNEISYISDCSYFEAQNVQLDIRDPGNLHVESNFVNKELINLDIESPVTVTGIPDCNSPSFIHRSTDKATKNSNSIEDSSTNVDLNTFDKLIGTQKKISTIAPPFVCTLCASTFKSSENLHLHMLHHRTGKLLKCQLCSKQFRYSCLISLHQQSHGAIRPHKCTVCDKEFITACQLRQHVVKHGDERTHQCNMCKKAFWSVSGLNQHLVSHNDRRPHGCTVCHKFFKTRSTLMRHLKIHGTERPHQCNVCGKDFTSSDSLRAHMITHQTERPHQCTVCGMHVKTLLALKRHMTSHSTERPYKCNVCDKDFKSMKNLNGHTARVHRAQRTQQCHLCGKVFKTKHDLYHHITSHSTERPHQCTVCQKSFKTVPFLKTHMSRHSTKRPHQCSLCGKAFNMLYDLKDHQIHHSNERTHPCSVCDKYFKTSSGVRQHMISHSDDRPHQCSLCDKQFKTDRALRLHSTCHSTERTFRCDVCDKRFKTIKHLRKHTKIHLL